MADKKRILITARLNPDVVARAERDYELVLNSDVQRAWGFPETHARLSARARERSSAAMTTENASDEGGRPSHHRNAAAMQFRALAAAGQIAMRRVNGRQTLNRAAA